MSGQSSFQRLSFNPYDNLHFVDPQVTPRIERLKLASNLLYDAPTRATYHAFFLLLFTKAAKAAKLPEYAAQAKPSMAEEEFRWRMLNISSESFEKFVELVQDMNEGSRGAESFVSKCKQFVQDRLFVAMITNQLRRRREDGEWSAFLLSPYTARGEKVQDRLRVTIDKEEKKSKKKMDMLVEIVAGWVALLGLDINSPTSDRVDLLGQELFFAIFDPVLQTISTGTEPIKFQERHVIDLNLPARPSQSLQDDHPSRQMLRLSVARKRNDPFVLLSRLRMSQHLDGHLPLEAKVMSFLTPSSQVGDQADQHGDDHGMVEPSTPLQYPLSPVTSSADLHEGETKKGRLSSQRPLVSGDIPVDTIAFPKVQVRG